MLVRFRYDYTDVIIRPNITNLCPWVSCRARSPKLGSLRKVFTVYKAGFRHKESFRKVAKLRVGLQTGALGKHS